MEFIYWRHPSVPGIKIEEVSGGEYYERNVWREMAIQVYCENGREAYREIGHYHNGAPFIYGDNSRISITHCNGLLAVATLPPTPEVDLSVFSERACLGIDAESADRSQVLNIRTRFLNDDELAMLPADDVKKNVQAWTIKEAAYKAAMTEGLDFRKNIRIDRMPVFGPPTPVFEPEEFGLSPDVKKLPEEFLGSVTVKHQDGSIINLLTYSYISDNCIVTLSYSPRSAKFGKFTV